MKLARLGCIHESAIRRHPRAWPQLHLPSAFQIAKDCHSVAWSTKELLATRSGNVSKLSFWQCWRSLRLGVAQKLSRRYWHVMPFFNHSVNAEVMLFMFKPSKLHQNKHVCYFDKPVHGVFAFFDFTNETELCGFILKSCSPLKILIIT